MGGGAALRSVAARGAGLLRALGGVCTIKPCADRDDVAPDGAGAAADAQEDALTEELFNKVRHARSLLRKRCFCGFEAAS